MKATSMGIIEWSTDSKGTLWWLFDVAFRWLFEVWPIEMTQWLRKKNAMFIGTRKKNVFRLDGSKAMKQTRESVCVLSKHCVFGLLTVVSCLFQRIATIKSSIIAKTNRNCVFSAHKNTAKFLLK